MEVADQVRKALPQDLPEMGSVLNRAFFDDPLFGWSIPDDDRRQHFYLDFFTLYAKAYLRQDQIYTTDGEVVAAVLWAPPGAEPISDEDAEELGQRIEALPGPDASRFQQLLKAFADHHPHGSYWYLTFMGVIPGWPGPGHRLSVDGAGAGAL